MFAGHSDTCLQVVPDLIRRLYGPGRDVTRPTLRLHLESLGNV